MSLLDELKAIEPGYNGMNTWVVKDTGIDVEIISDEITDTGRWAIYSTAVFQRGDEYVALDYEEPATEIQECADADYEFYEVRPEQVVVTKYVKV